MIRCPWSINDTLYQKYHDNEWGVPIYDDKKLFELLLLEWFQAGLSWLTILKKRENFRNSFDNFDYNKIALYNQIKLEQLLQDVNIIRNKKKIRASKINANAFLKIRKDYGSFSNYLWNFNNGKIIMNHWKNENEIPISTPLSDKISKDLKSKGFVFLGTITVYAFMQACGVVNDHLENCFFK